MIICPLSLKERKCVRPKEKCSRFTGVFGIYHFPALQKEQLRRPGNFLSPALIETQLFTVKTHQSQQTSSSAPKARVHHPAHLVGLRTRKRPASCGGTSEIRAKRRTRPQQRKAGKHTGLRVRARSAPPTVPTLPWLVDAVLKTQASHCACGQRRMRAGRGCGRSRRPGPSRASAVV